MTEKLLGLAHIGVNISDAEASKDFYINKLGFVLKNEAVLANGVKLIFVDAGSCQLELICPPVKKGPIPAGVVNHICVECKNIEAWADYLRNNRVAMESDKVGCMPDLFNGVKNFFCAGPDGERIEFFEYLG